MTKTAYLIALGLMVMGFWSTLGPAAGLVDCRQTIRGLVLGTSTVTEVLSRLGPTMVFKKNGASESRHLCYLSDRDDRLVAFTTHRNIVTGLQLLADKHRYDRWDWCTATPLTSGDLTLPTGITLGMHPEDVCDILGDPQAGDRDHLSYIFGLNSPAEKRKWQCHPDKPGREVLLELEFSDARLVTLDLKIRPNGYSQQVQKNQGNPICIR